MQGGDDGIGPLDPAELGLGGSRATGDQRGVEFLDQRFNLGRVQIAHEHEHHAFRPVPGVVEFNEALAGRLPDHVLDADREPLRETRVGHQEFQLGEIGAQADGIAGAFFTQDDAPLLLDPGRLKQQAAGDIGEKVQALAQRCRPGVG